MILLKITYGIILFAIGVAILKYRKTVYDWTGRFDWAERYIGSGGTVVVLILFGLFMIFLSIAYPMGLFDGYQLGGSNMSNIHFNSNNNK